MYALCFWGHDPDDPSYRVSLRFLVREKGDSAESTMVHADMFGAPIPIGDLRARANALGIAVPRGVDVVVFADFGFRGVDFSKPPTGLVNFSRIDDAELVLLGGRARRGDRGLRVMALNQQPVHVMAGMCGLAFSK